MEKLIIGISGASGAIYGIRLLEILCQLSNIETHLIVSNAAQQTIALETNYSLDKLYQWADVVHNNYNMAASISSGSFRSKGMVIIPCSIKTLSGIVHSYSDNLIIRTADVMLKERLPLILAVRETPLHLGHLRLMVQASELGALIMPPMPAFYHHPQQIMDIVDQTINRIFDQLAISLPTELFVRWQGSNSC